MKIFSTVYSNLYLLLLNSQSVKSTKPLKEVQQEIQAIMRQITASVTFLPLLDGPTCVDLLVYSNRDADVPATWADSDPCLIQNGEEVAFRSFSTKVVILRVKTLCFDRIDNSLLLLFFN